MSTKRNTFVDGLLHGNTGQHNAKSRLTDEDVTEILIRWECGATIPAPAKDFKYSLSGIAGIVHRRTWTHVPMPDITKERFERNVLGIKRGVAGAVVRLNLAASMCLLTSAHLVGPGGLLKALLRMKFWPGRAARERRAQMLLKFVGPGPAPEPPDPDGWPAEGYRDSGDEAAEEEQEFTWPQRPLFGLPPVYPKPLRDWREPRAFRNQAVPLGRGDRAWADEDVRAIRGSKRFQLLIGGRSDDGGGDQDQGEKRQA